MYFFGTVFIHLYVFLYTSAVFLFSCILRFSYIYMYFFGTVFIHLYVFLYTSAVFLLVIYSSIHTFVFLLGVYSSIHTFICISFCIPVLLKIPCIFVSCALQHAYIYMYCI